MAIKPGAVPVYDNRSALTLAAVAIFDELLLEFRIGIQVLFLRQLIRSCAARKARCEQCQHDRYLQSSWMLRFATLHG